MIREAGEKDIEIIAEFNCKMALETENKRLEMGKVVEGVKNAINDKAKASYYLYEKDKKVVGQLMLTKEWSDWRNGYFWWIQSVYVDEKYRRQGIFKALYEYVENLVEEDTSACGLRLYVEKNNNRAQKTYTKMGMGKTNYIVYEKIK